MGLPIRSLLDMLFLGRTLLPVGLFRTFLCPGRSVVRLKSRRPDIVKQPATCRSFLGTRSGIRLAPPRPQPPLFFAREVVVGGSEKRCAIRLPETGDSSTDFIPHPDPSDRQSAELLLREEEALPPQPGGRVSGEAKFSQSLDQLVGGRTWWQLWEERVPGEVKPSGAPLSVRLLSRLARRPLV